MDVNEAMKTADYWGRGNKKPVDKYSILADSINANLTDKDIVGERGPRTAGLNMQVDSYSKDDVRTDMQRGDLWNVGNASMIQVPTDKYMKEFSEGRRMPAEELYSKEYAEEHELGIVDRLQLWNDTSRIDNLKLTSEKMKPNNKGYAQGTREGTSKIAYNRDNTSGENAHTVPHELNHAIQVGNDQLTDFDKDYEADRNLPYKERGYEAAARLGGNKGMYTEELLSSKSKYGVHPLLDVDKSGKFSTKNGFDYLNALVRTGRVSKKDATDLYKNLKKESTRMQEMYDNDADFRLKINQANKSPNGDRVRYALSSTDSKKALKLNKGVSKDRRMRGDTDIEKQFFRELGYK